MASLGCGRGKLFAQNADIMSEHSFNKEPKSKRLTTQCDFCYSVDYDNI